MIKENYYNMNDKKIYLFLILMVVVVHSILGQTIDIKREDCEKGKIRIKLKKEQLMSVNSSLKSSSAGINGAGIGVKSIDRISQEVGIKRIKRVFPFSLKHEVKHRKYGLHLWIELEFDEDVDPLSVVEQYKGLEELEIVKPIYKKVRIDADEKSKPYKVEVLSKGKATLKTSSTESYNAFFDDPFLADQWHYENDGRIGEDALDIDLFEAWEKTSWNSDIIVAIVDQGVDVNHEDLQENIWRNEAEINGEEGVDDDQNGYIDDFHGYNFNMDGAILSGDHGTHVAGTVGAVSNNGIGVAGVAGGNGNDNGVKMISCQVFDERTNGGANFASAIIYGADNGAVISQNSWGYNGENYYEPEVYEAIMYFVAEAGQYEGSPMKGGVVIFAAGNTGTEIMRYPSAFDEVISVTSISANGLPAPYTTFGNWADIGALGGDYTNFGEEGGILSTLPDNKYGYMEGTSMACPHVSGVAALVISKNESEDFKADDLKRILINSTNRFIFQHNNTYGTGLLNAANALADDNRIPPVAINDLRAGDIFHNEVRLEWTVPVDEDNGEPRYYYLCIGASEITEQNFDNHALFLLENELKAGETFKINIQGFQKLTDYWFAIKSIDRFENLSDISNVLKVNTSNLPHFMESTRSISVDIDVTQETIKNVPIGLSNIGDGIVYFNSTVRNETYYREPEQEEEQALAASIQAKAEEGASNPELYEATHSYTKGLPSLMSASSESEDLSHWENDNTEWLAGMSYQNETNPAILLSSGNSNAGLIMATRFDIPYDYSFNLTHLEVALSLEMNDKPIIVELRKGSKWVQESESVYMQEYYPDTINVLKYYRIPLYRPQRFEDNEIFWVVLHFPKEMRYPLAMQFGEERYGYFVMSKDNGANYQDAVYYVRRPIIPMLSALSSGDDGSYVFLDPVSGEIPKGETVNPNVTIDAANLTNGKHLASLGIATNDIHKPIVNIEVKVDVTGQLPEIDAEKTYQFKAFTNEENILMLDLHNIGLADLEVYNISSLKPGFTKAFADTLIMTPDLEWKVPFNYTPVSSGLHETQLTLITNIGDINLFCEFSVVDAPLFNLSADTVVDVVYGEKAYLNLQINNTGSGSVLEYDLNHYDFLNISKGIFPDKLEYKILNSGDTDGPADNIWDDISALGEVTTLDSISGKEFKLGMSFPFFSESIDKAYMNKRGELYFYYDGLLSNHPDADFYGIAKGLFMPFKIKDQYLKIKRVLHYSFGDRIVFSVDANIHQQGGTPAPDGEVSYQIALFRDGTIEYRYNNVDYIKNGFEYTVAIQGLNKEDLLLYKDFEETGKDLYKGKVVRFEPVKDLSMIVSASPINGVISAGESASVELVIEPEAFGLMAGTYQNEVLVNTNSANKEERWAFSINVTGTPEVTVSDTVDFGTVKLGFEGNSFVPIQNIGSSGITVDAISFDNSDFILGEALPLNINALSKLFLAVVYTPTNVSEVETTALISFSDGAQKSVVLKGKCVDDASYDISIPADIVIDINGGEKVSVPFSLTNHDKDVQLEYTFKNNWLSYVETDGLSRGEGNNSIGSSYGYWWNVSDEDNPYYKWDDISNEAEVLVIEQDKQKQIELPFQFPFFGEFYSTIWVSKNGYVTVVEPESDHFAFDFAKDDGLSGMIAPFWSPLRFPGEDKGVQLKIEDSRVILQWDEFVPENNPGIASFQLEILADGAIHFHYKKVEGYGGGLNYGLESPDENETVDTEKSWILSWSILSDACTVSFIPPLKDSIESGMQVDMDLVLSAERIYKSGVYKDTVELYSNSKAQALYKIPVQLNVTGTSVLDISTSLDWSDVVYHDDLMLTRKVKLTNTGYDVLHLNKVVHNDLDNLVLYDETGVKLVKTSAGNLLNDIVIEPWSDYQLIVEIPVDAQNDINGSITWSGNFESLETPVVASIIDSPVFTWDASDQTYSLNNTQVEEYSFTIKNEGETLLKYNLAPAVAPKGGDVEYPVIIEEEGNFTYNDPIIIASMSLDKKEKADGVFTPLIEGSDLGFSNRYTAPQGGFFLTHVKIFTCLLNIDEYVRLGVSLGGDLPQNGQILFDQKFIVDEIVDEKWIYLPLAQPISIPEGEQFFVSVYQSKSTRYMGYENTIDQSLLDNSFSGIFYEDDQYHWWTNTMDLIWKIRPLTAAGEDSWVELDQYTGELPAGESVDVLASIYPSLAGQGEQNAKIIGMSNDINNSRKEFNISLNVNGAPEFKYYPNIYKDTLTIIETEDILLNYLLEDPENESMTFAMDVDNKGPRVKYSLTGKTTAQVKVKTDYNDEGVYSYPVQVTDESGSFSTDTIVIKVLDKNRPPVLNESYASIVLNLADPSALTIDPSDLFTDPDGDELEIMAGNYSPEIVDLSLGTTYINLNPLTAGTALLVFAADDGKEDGFVIYGVYVQVIDDPDAVNSSLDGNGNIGEEEYSTVQKLTIYPNPVKDQISTVLIHLNEDADARVEIFDAVGRMLNVIQETNLNGGVHQYQVDFTTFGTGLYICRYLVNGKFIESKKVVVK
jgi:subtilisin family serine protease